MVKTFKANTSNIAVMCHFLPIHSDVELSPEDAESALTSTVSHQTLMTSHLKQICVLCFLQLLPVQIT